MTTNVRAFHVLAIVLAVATDVLASPIQLEEESGIYRQDDYPPAEYSRYYEDREPQSRRNLDQIGGGNLVRGLSESRDDGSRADYARNLDPIGGGNLVRSLDLKRAFERIGNGEFLETRLRPSARVPLVLRNLDPIGGGNLLRNVKVVPWRDEKPDSVHRNLDHIGNPFEPRLVGISERFLRPARRGLDSLSGATFGESKRSASPRRATSPNDYERLAKRNIDEIDRTGFDGFYKRNFDEIDRDGFDGFVKRLDDYLASRRRR